MEELHKYVPKKESGFQRLTFGGYQLTACRARGVQTIRVTSEKSSEGL